MKKDFLGRQSQSFDSLMKGKKFVVPAYQRGYRWSEKNWQGFYESIFGLNKKKYDDIHFFGNIIIKESESFDKHRYVEYEIVDGHQRIATFFIFLASMIKTIDELIKDGKIKPNEVKGYKDLKKNIINLVYIDDYFNEKEKFEKLKFSPYNLNEKKELKAIFSNKENQITYPSVIKKSFEFFNNKLNNNSMLNLDGAKNIFRNIEERICIIDINLSKETKLEEVLEIFDIINDTGKLLEPADKLKSFLFEKSIENKEEDDERSKSKEIDKAKEKWESMEKTFDNNSKLINSFLYNFFASIFKRDKDLKKKDFYEFVKKQFNLNKLNITELLEKIDNYSNFYKNVVKPNSFFSKNNFERDFKRLLIDISRLGYSQLHQLILVLYFDDHLDDNKKIDILDMITKCMFRRVTVKDLKASKEFENKIHHFVDLVREKKGEEILKNEYLRNEFESKEERNDFYNKLELRNLNNNNNKYILSKYYLALKPKVFQYNGKEELEHLAPQSVIKNENHLWKLIDKWKELKQKDLEILINSIGNLTIIENYPNKVVGSKLWSEKISDINYLNNVCLSLEEDWEDGENIIQNGNKKILIDDKVGKTGKEKELYPEEIKNRTKNLIKEIKKLGIFEFNFEKNK
ncbi:MAG: hypothetical protein AD073_000322 [Mycoplasmataceae bacterium]|nr:MAG: hypothetical protein AD073_000322 [Mycoplasmataceae bacterium]